MAAIVDMRSAVLPGCHLHHRRPVVLVPATIIPIVIIVSIFVQMPMRRAVERSYREGAQKHAALVETINGLDSIKVASAEGRRQRDWNGYVAASARLRNGLALLVDDLRQLHVAGLQYGDGRGRLLGRLSYGRRVDDDRHDGGGLHAVQPRDGALGADLRPDRALPSVLDLAQGAQSLMNLPTERPVGKVFLRRPNIEGAIEFRNVKFKYPGQQGLALDGVSFKINPGERVGIVGRIGLRQDDHERLVMNLYEPEDGAVLIDGTDIRQVVPRTCAAISLRPAGWRAVLRHGQRQHHARGALRDEASIHRAAMISGVESFIKGHPHGFDLPVGEGGRMLSGGQRQAIVIARALLMDPPILVMDEADQFDGQQHGEYLQSEAGRGSRRQDAAPCHASQLHVVRSSIV